MSLTDDFLKAMQGDVKNGPVTQKKKKKPETITDYTGGDDFTRSFLDELNRLNKVGEMVAPTVGKIAGDIAPVGDAVRKVSRGILHSAGHADMSLEELEKAKNTSRDPGDRLRYTARYNEKLLAGNAELLAKTKMDGTNHSVLDEMKLIAQMESGKEKKQRKAAVLSKMEELGVDTSDYALYAGDSNFSLGAFGDWAGNAAMSGLASFNKGITSTADVLLGNPLKAMGWENNPVSELADYYGDVYDSYKYSTDLMAQKLGGGKGYEFAGAAIEGVLGAVPNALLAIMSAGTSMGATTTSLTTQAAAQSGNLLTKAGLTTSAMAKNPQYWLSFARTFGTDYEEAKAMGASDATATLGATLTSLINAGIEIGIDGGSGIQGLPDDLKKGGSKALKWAVSAAEEGGEEGLQRFVNEIVAKTMYDSDAEILNPKEYAREIAIGAISGAALGGGQIAAQKVLDSAAKAAQERENAKLTENEQKVVDKVTSDRIAEQEQDGKKLTDKAKKQIREAVIRAMEDGSISTDTIEEVLGGETYKTYKDTIDSEDAIKKEFDTLNKMKQGEMTGEQIDRRAELKEQLEAIKKEAKRDQLKSQLGEEVMVLTKGDRLSESYNEKGRRGQAFEADLSKYDAKQQKVIQKAVESGILNNTNRTHKFVDMIAKISADKGVLFDFTNNKKLKESGFALDGKTVNGYVTKDGVTININSAKALNSVVGHEITHVLQGTEFYAELQKALFDYAKAKGDYQGRYDSLTKLYEGVEGADIEEELTADLVGDYLFTDADFVNRLSTENRNVFQKIYDEIKYLCKVAAAGSKEARQLEKVKKIFEKVYKESAKTPADTKYSIGEIIDKNNNSYGIGVYLDSTLLDNLTPDERKVMVKERIKELGGEVFTAYDSNGNAVNITIAKPGASFKNQNGKRRPVNKDLTTKYIGNEVKQEAVVLIDELIATSKFQGTDPAKHAHDWLDNNGQNDWDVWTTYIQDKNNTIWEATLHIANTANGEKVIYDVDPTKKVGQSGNSDTSLPSNTVAQEAPDVKYSLSNDGEQIAPYGDYNVSGKDIALDIAPVGENVAVQEKTQLTEDNSTGMFPDDFPIRSDMFPDDFPIREELDELYQQKKALENRMQEARNAGDEDALTVASNAYGAVTARIGYLQPENVESVKETPDNAPVGENAAVQEKTQLTEDNATENNDPDAFDDLTDEDVPPEVENAPVKENSTVQKKIHQKILNTQKELDENRQLRDQSIRGYDEEIARLQAKYDAKKNKNTRAAQSILRSIERLKRIRDNIDVDYAKRISDLEARVEKLHSEEYSRAEHRRAKQKSYTAMWEDMIGDTSTWTDLPWGMSYKTKTLRRILRKVVKDADGNPDIAKADRIYDELETKYDHNEALLKRESQKLKEVFFELNLNQFEDTYAHMLGELRHNPETKLSMETVDEYYNAHKGEIDTAKVDEAITEARKLFDDLIVRANKVLKEQGFKEIFYRVGYFPHFRNPKQGWLAKRLNWKTVDDDIPTDIAGLTKMFKPQRSWQSFIKRRKGDKTDYSLYQGLDRYIHGALDWIYHIEDIQKRRALENYLRYIHSEEGVKQRIKDIQSSDIYDAIEAQKMINAVLQEANNPLGGLVIELMNRTNTLANKKSSMDREVEEATNRKIYSTMTNLNSRINANTVVGSISSALTNFIPMVQSWHQVSPLFTVRGLDDFVRSTVFDDGVVAKSDFLTNRLMEEENLYKTGWDKISDKAAFMMNAFDTITSQTVWRSKYLQNLKEGMSESQAIKDADQFAKNLMAGRSRGNQPTIFDAKNPLIKMFTAFQLEVANQYGYMFEDLPHDSTSKVRLVKGYVTAFVGAYLYNTLYSSLVGRDAAFDPIGIIEDLFRDLFDEDEEPVDVILNLADNIVDELPFVGGLSGGGRIPLSTAFPYGDDSTPFRNMLKDVDEENWEGLKKELLRPLWYLGLPVGGGQIKKTVEGLSMFDDDFPIAGSYTDSGNLRFPVEETPWAPWSRIQAGVFGQYASKNARDYFDNGESPLNEKQTQEFKALDIPIQDYWKYRDEAKKISDRAESEDASDEDILKSKYLNSVNSELSELIKEKEDVLESPFLSDKLKQEQIDRIQEQFDEMSRECYESYNDVSFEKFNGDNYARVGEYVYKKNDEGEWEALSDEQLTKYEVTKAAKGAYYATDGTNHYKYTVKDGYGTWYKISEDELEKQREVTRGLGISPEEYWGNKTEYTFAYNYPEKYQVARACGGYEEFDAYQDVLWDIKADKDENGKSISGSRKTKVIKYINGLDCDYGVKLILFKNEYNADDTYNYEIIDYLNSRSDISYKEMETILKYLGFEVDSEGNITW